MFYGRRYPFTDFNKINLDWILRKLKEQVPPGIEKLVSYIAQTPTSSEQQTARDNLGLGDLSTENGPLAVTKGGTGANTVAGARSSLGLGSLAVEDSPLALNKGGTGANTVAGARSNLGLGSLAVEDSPLAVNKGGTGATDYATAKENLFIRTSGKRFYWVIDCVNGNDNNNGTYDNPLQTVGRALKLSNGCSDIRIAFKVAGTYPIDKAVYNYISGMSIHLIAMENNTILQFYNANPGTPIKFQIYNSYIHLGSVHITANDSLGPYFDHCGIFAEITDSTCYLKDSGGTKHYPTATDNTYFDYPDLTANFSHFYCNNCIVRNMIFAHSIVSLRNFTIRNQDVTKHAIHCMFSTLALKNSFTLSVLPSAAAAADGTSILFIEQSTVQLYNVPANTPSNYYYGIQSIGCLLSCNTTRFNRFEAITQAPSSLDNTVHFKAGASPSNITVT